MDFKYAIAKNLLHELIITLIYLLFCVNISIFNNAKHFYKRLIKNKYPHQNFPIHPEIRLLWGIGADRN
jgi:hypothetical protein